MIFKLFGRKKFEKFENQTFQTFSEKSPRWEKFEKLLKSLKNKLLRKKLPILGLSCLKFEKFNLPPIKPQIECNEKFHDDFLFDFLVPGLRLSVFGPFRKNKKYRLKRGKGLDFWHVGPENWPENRSFDVFITSRDLEKFKTRPVRGERENTTFFVELFGFF